MQSTLLETRKVIKSRKWLTWWLPGFQIPLKTPVQSVFNDHINDEIHLVASPRGLLLVKCCVHRSPDQTITYVCFFVLFVRYKPFVLNKSSSIRLMPLAKTSWIIEFDYFANFVAREAKADTRQRFFFFFSRASGETMTGRARLIVGFVFVSCGIRWSNLCRQLHPPRQLIYEARQRIYLHCTQRFPFFS